MADALTEYLLNDRTSHAKISAEQLELLGKQASNALIERGVPMNETIAKEAAAYPDIAPEQIKRIVEYANTAAYLSKHEQNKTAGAESSYPQFKLADAGAIIQELSDGARPTVVTPTDISYSLPPPKRSRSQEQREEKERRLDELFDHQKLSSAQVDVTAESGLNDLTNTKDNLVGLRDNLVHAINQFDSILKVAEADYYTAVKQHLLDGGSFADVLNAAQHTGARKEKIASVLAPVLEQLLIEKVAKPYQLHMETKGLSKVAHRIVDPTHDLVLLFKAVSDTQAELEKSSMARKDADEQIKYVSTVLKEATLAQLS